MERPVPAPFSKAPAQPAPPSQTDMLDRITASLPSLAPAEQRVAKLVLTDPRTFARLPVRELA